MKSSNNPNNQMKMNENSTLSLPELQALIEDMAEEEFIIEFVIGGDSDAGE